MALKPSAAFFSSLFSDPFTQKFGHPQAWRFGSFAELNAWLGERCRALWQELRHPQHKAFSIAEVLELEQSHLMLMPVAFDGYVEPPAKVSSTCPIRLTVRSFNLTPHQA